MPLIDELRRTFGQDLSDDELLVKASDELGLPMGKIASEAGIRTGGKWGSRASAAVDSAQAQMSDVVGTAARGLGWDQVADWADQTRTSNESQAQARRRIAQAQGAVMDYTDIKGVRDIPEYVGGLALDTGPQILSSIAGAGVGALAAGPAGAVVGSGLANAAYNFADIQGNMREQGQEPDALKALALTPVYTAFDLVGPEGKAILGLGKKLARRGATEVAEEVAGQEAKKGLFAETTGVKGALARGATAVAGGALKEGGAELGQEVTNQAGRIWTDPNLHADDPQSWLAGDAEQRYISSFIGGAALGGTIDAVGHAFSRHPSDPADRPSIDQTGGRQLVGTPTAAPAPAAGLTPDMVGQTPPAAPAATGADPGAAAGVPPTAPGAAPNVLTDAAAAATAPAPPPPAETPDQVLARKAEETAQILKDRTARAETFGIKGTRNVDLLHDLEQANKDGLLDDAELAHGIGMIKANRAGDARSLLKEKRDEQTIADSQKPATAPETAQPVPAPAPTATEAPAASGAPPAAPAAVAPPAVSTAAPATAAPAATPATAKVSAPAAAPVAPRKTTGATFIEHLEKENNKKLSEDDRQTIYAVSGMDEHGEQVSAPLTMERASERLTQRGFKGGVSKQAIDKRLKKYTLGGNKLSLDLLHALNRIGNPGEHAAPEVAEHEDQLQVDTDLENKGFTIADEGRENVSNVTNEEEESAGKALEKMVGALATRSDSPLNPEQRKALTDVVKQRKSVQQGKTEGDKSLSGLRSKLRTVLADEKLFPDRKLAETMGEAFGATEGRKAKAEAADKAAREEEATRKANEAQVKAKNEAVIAENKAKADEAAALAEQWREQKKMSSETREEALRDALKPDVHNDIADAQEWWDGNLEEETEPAFDDLDTDLQAHWVNYFSNYYGTDKDKRVSQKLSLSRRHEEISGEARGKGITRNRYGQDKTAATRVPGEGLPAAGRAAEATSGVGQEAGAKPGAVQGAEGGHAAAGLQEDAGRNAAGSPAGSEKDQAAADGQHGGEHVALRNLERTTMTGAAPVGQETVAGRKRAPSLTRAVRKARALFDEGTITADQFAAQTGAALDAADHAELYSDVPARQRGSLILREKLLAAHRRGEISAEMAEFGDWLLRQNPQWATDLGISLKARTDKNAGTSGFYTPVARIITLIKGSDMAQTVVHEVLHHLERMMPVPLQNAIRREWSRQLARALRKAKRLGDDPWTEAYFQAVMDYHYGDGHLGHRVFAEKLLKDGKVSYDLYQFFNPSEFWAINGTDIMQGRFDVSESMLGRMRQWLSEVVERIKGAFGLNSNAAILHALNSLARSDGRFQTGVMIHEQPGVHFMYAGENAATQEQAEQLKTAQTMEDWHFEPEQIRAATGWFKGADEKWRFELSDKGASFKADFAAMSDKLFADASRLGDVLDHPELFKAYPAAADIKFVKFLPWLDFDKSLQGSFDGKNTISVTSYAKDPLSTLLHEVQHWVQRQEGFATGGNVEAVFDKLTDTQRGELAEHVAGRMERELQPHRERARTMVQVAAHKDFDNLHAVQKSEDRLNARSIAWRERVPDFAARMAMPEWNAIQERLSTLRSLRFKLRDRITNDIFGKDYQDTSSEQQTAIFTLTYEKTVEDAQIKAMAAAEAVMTVKEDIQAIRDGDEDALKESLSHNDKFSLYQRIAGEVEARDVQARMEMDEAERRATEPYASQKIPRARMLVHHAEETESQLSQDEPGFQNIERMTRGFTAAPKATAMAAFKLNKNIAKGIVAPWLQASRFTRDLLKAAAKALPSAERYGQAMERIAARRLQMQREVARIVDSAKRLPAAERARASSYMQDSTLGGKWGFVPSWVKDFKPGMIDATLKTRFDALSDAAQKAVIEAFHHSHNELLDMRDAVEKKANAAFTDEDKKQEFMDRFNKLTRMHENTPYLPLKRFGNYVVVAKSTEYQTAEEASKAAYATPAKQRTQEEKKAIADFAAMETNPMHYRVSFRETRREAETLSNDWRQSFGDNVDIANRDDGYKESFSSGVQTLGLVARMRAMSNDPEASKEAQQTMAKLLTDFELSMLSEVSVRQSERRRKGIYGADEDMFRSFGTKGMSAANFIAAMESGGAAEQALGDMKKEANAFGTRGGLTHEQRATYFNEISKRHYMGFDYKPSPMAESALRISSIFQLMFNPAYHLVNALQPLTISAPWLAGKHGMVRTLGAFTKAYREVGPTVTTLAKAIESNDYSGLPEDVRSVVRDLVDRGAISADMIYEHGRTKWKTDDASNLPAKAIRKTNEIMDAVGSTVEFTNRVTTAMAAYRLAKADGQVEASARESAFRAIYETHGDYSGFNAPRFMRGPLARVLTQYRKFQFIQLGMWGRLMRDSFAGSGLSKDEKWVARKQLAFSLGMMQSVAGLMGLPGASMISLVLDKIFGDADDPDDAETKMRKMVGDPSLADMLLKGLPAMLGVDISDKIGAGRIFTPLPYTEIPHDRDTYSKTLTAALGPFIGGLGPKMADGMGQLWQGNYWKGIESMMPNGFGNAMKGMRLATVGMTQKNGDMVIGPEDISAFDGVMQAAGLPTSKITDRAYIQQVKYNSDKFFKERTTQIKHAYTQAVKDNDFAGMADARQDWADTNASRVAHGYTPQPLSNLLKAPSDQAKREKSSVGGVIPAGKRDAGALRQLEELTE